IALKNDKVDVTVWRSECGKDGKFTIKQAYKDLCDNDEVVIWHKCEYSAEVWAKIKVKAGIQIVNIGWNELVEEMSVLYCGNSIDSIIRRLSFAACVYLIWQERN
ncbi:hypothetical protein Tco_0958008, partial [Tanacetum coccineum]